MDTQVRFPHRDHRNSFKSVSIATSKGREGDEQ